jgi:hypothetical protein
MTPVTATPVATPQPTVEPPVGTWTVETSLPGFAAEDVLVVPGRMIAVGCRTPKAADDCDAAAIRVSDGSEWTPARLDGDTAQVQLFAVASSEDGYAAVGRDAGSGDGTMLDGAAFVSTDGRTWRRAPDQGSLQGHGMVDIVAGPRGGWIAVGPQAGPTHFFGFDTWSSSDGLTWTLVASVPDVGSVHGVTTYARGLIAWGSDCLGVCGPPERAAIWTSDDGTTWTRAPAQPTLRGGWIDAVIPTTTGALAVGATYDTEGNGVGTAWSSEDGLAWSRTALPDSSGYQSFRLAALGDDLVAIGRRSDGNGTTSGTWTSTNGSSWTRLKGADLDAVMPGLAAMEADVIAVGRTSGTPAGDSSVWRLRLD